MDARLPSLFRRMLPSAAAACVASFCHAAFAPEARGAEIEVEVSFATLTGRTAQPAHYGLNLFQIYNPTTAQNNATYRNNLVAMKPGLVRLHSWEMMGTSAMGNGWITTSNSWDADKIGRALRGGFGWKPRVMVNVPWGPSGATPSAVLTEPQEEAFAKFCADLVKIINIDNKLGATYFELPNERDDLYKDKGTELGRLFVKAARAMKKVDPNIKVGGPAFIQPWSPIVDDFLAAAKADLDFVSYHTYATGDRNSDVQKLFDHAASLGGIAKQFKDKLAKLGRTDVELYHDEYNISWAPPDVRMNDQRGAVFDAIAMMGFAQSEVTGAAAWNEADGWYGKLDPAFGMRPAAHVFALFNTHLVGSVATAKSASPSVVAMAIRGPRANALALVNRSAEAHTISLKGASGPAEVHQVTTTGLSSRAVGDLARASLALPALSVAVVTTQPVASPTDNGPAAGGAGGGGGGAGAGGAGGEDAGSGGGAGKGGSAGGGGAFGKAPGTGGKPAPSRGEDDVDEDAEDDATNDARTTVTGSCTLASRSGQAPRGLLALIAVGALASISRRRRR